MQQMNAGKKAARHYDAVDVARLVFCIAIVIRHTNLAHCLPKAVRVLVLCHSVPFFFLASGYFLYRNVQGRGADAACRKYALRMLQPLAIFEGISVLLYVAYRLYQGHAVRSIFKSCVREILFYPRGSMWYLQACIVGCLLLYPFYKMKIHPAVMALLGLPLFGFALLCNNYRFAAEKLGLGPLVDGFIEKCISARNGPFYAFFFLALGGAVAALGLEERLGRRLAAALFALSMALCLLEERFLTGRLRIDDRSLYAAQILVIPLLFICLCQVRRSFSCAALCRKYSAGIYYLQKIVLYALTCIVSILGWNPAPPLTFTLVMLICAGICTAAYRDPKLEKLLS